MDKVAVVKPLRIDLAGGWSDTPPICFRRGGCVLNFAVELNGLKPVKVEVARLAENRLKVESVDLGKKATFITDAEIADHHDPHDWCALTKSALSVVGYKIGEGGLFIRLSADVPKGSGLGTSSILGATLIEALGAIRGNRYSWQEICALTLALEREMHTGGGWQDQLGGILPGVKLLVSLPGENQRIRVKTLDRESETALARMFSNRALLYFTGQKRMARNVLRGVLKYYEANPCGIAEAIIDRIKRDAAHAFDAIVRRDWHGLCAAINGYWMSKKALDPGSTNPMVESIIARIAPWTSAVSLCGAGGGGFMFIIAANRKCRDKIREVLGKYPPVESGQFFDFKIA